MSDNKVETELLSQIKEVLLKFPKYWEKDVLLRNKVAEDLRNYNQELIEALLSNQLVKDTYSISDYFAVSSPPISIWSPLIRETSPPLFLTRIRISRQPIRASSPLNSFFCV